MTTRAAQDQDDDRSLLRRYARDGDAEAFAELVHRYVALVYGVCLRVTRSRADAEDVTQECLLELAKNAAKVHTSVGGYLHTVATRRSLMHCRSAGRRAQREATIVPADAEHDPASAAHITEVVDTALQELDEESRNLIIQRFLQGRSQQAIAAGLGVDQSTVSRKLTDAIEKMRKRLAGMGMMAGVAEVATTMEKLGGAPAPPGLASSAVKIGIAGAGAARSSGVAPLTYTMMIVFVVLAGALGYALHAREGTKIMTGPTTASSAGIHPDLKGTHLSGFGMKRDSVSVAFQAAAQALGKDADYERLYLLSGNAFAPAINTGETCRSWWHVQARMGTRNLPAMADSVGLSAERLAVPALPDTATEAQRAAVRKTAADLARQAMDSGAVVITEGGWDEAGAWVWSGVVTDIADDGTMRGAALSAVTGDGKEHVLWKYPGSLWAIRRGDKPSPVQANDQLILATAIARIRGTGDYAAAGADTYGLAAMDQWIASMRDIRGFCPDCFRSSPVKGVQDAPDNDQRMYEAARIVARQLRRGMTGLSEASRPHLEQAAGCYDRIAQLLEPGATGKGGFRWDALSSLEAQRGYVKDVLDPVKNELDQAAVHMERALAVEHGTKLKSDVGPGTPK